MTMTKKVSLLLILLLVVGFIGGKAVVQYYKDHSDVFNLFRPLQVTIDNQSDLDLVRIEIGVLQSQIQSPEDISKVIVEEPLESGSIRTIQPDLELAGEGGVYIKLTDSQGSISTHGVCSYTESLSGRSKITVHNSGTDVDEDCW
ncbi:hypothetical protein [Marinicrinis sediminis]|uniref:Uncharacterized protein n=1 Tax=Marinicrinis sediminis TaxID=1652465 RepID=A0ABW5REA5_9BACL